MGYGWAAVFTFAAWFVGFFIEANLNWGDIGLHVVFPVIVMGCCIMKFIKDNDQTK